MVFYIIKLIGYQDYTFGGYYVNTMHRGSIFEYMLKVYIGFNNLRNGFFSYLASPAPQLNWNPTSFIHI
jgi:hypothetical protein